MTLLHQAAQKAVEAPLKPCPFCGGDAELDARQAYRAVGTGRGGTRIAVYCRDCGADIGCCREDVPDIEPEQVIEMWNRRVAPDDLPALVRQLVHALRKAAPEHMLAERALDYLRRHGLQGSPLRTAALQHQEVLREPVALERWGRAKRNGSVLLERMADGYWTPWHIAQEALAASPSTTRQQEVGSREVVAYHDKDQPNGVAWCPGYPEKLLDIVPLYAGERTSKKLRAKAAAPSTPEKAQPRLVEGPPRDFGQAQDRYGEHMDRPAPGVPEVPRG